MRSKGSGCAAAVVLTLSWEGWAGLFTDHLSLCAGLEKSRLLLAWENSPADGKNYFSWNKAHCQPLGGVQDRGAGELPV